MNPVQPERLEPECDHGACCFRRKTLSPVRNANPIAELSTLVRRRDHQTDGAAEFAARRNRDGKRRRTSRAKFFLSVLQKISRAPASRTMAERSPRSSERSSSRGVRNSCGAVMPLLASWDFCRFLRRASLFSASVKSALAYEK